MSANSSPTGVTENSDDACRKNSATSEKNDEELQQLLAVCGDVAFVSGPEAQQKQELRITENPLLKRSSTGSHSAVGQADLSPVPTQPTATTVVRYEETPPGCWRSRRKANTTTRTSLERYVVIVVLLLLIACLGFLVFGYVLRPDCSDGKLQCHIACAVDWAVTLKRGYTDFHREIVKMGFRVLTAVVKLVKQCQRLKVNTRFIESYRFLLQG
jgi:hypothetical protein